MSSVTRTHYEPKIRSFLNINNHKTKMTRICIAVDAMGGDYGVDVTVPAVCRFLNLSENSDCRITLVGRQEDVEAALSQQSLAKELQDAGRIAMVNASEVVEMCEEPGLALKRKKD